ncbi:malonyl-CoA decarboxylase [Denitrobaculum tricleocarpae]|uniref:malonyl-CoA decarboxylase n=1 Tax=Denitrobaculum tricleocarpae TaxID=2591009 RepID=UPI001C553408|nr:malonyl-CoA decarboxylase [Denitrobaculum tricleocarpae]
MAVPETETLVERTLSNLAGAWRDIANSAARSVGLKAVPAANGDKKTIRKLMAECLEARGGEVSARMRAAELGKSYLELDTQGRADFLATLAREYALDPDLVAKAISDYQFEADPDAKLEAEERLRRVVIPPRVRLLKQFNGLPEGVKFLVDLRADLLHLSNGDPYLRGLDHDLRDLLSSWFDPGFLDMLRITWDSPAALLEKLIAYEAVHEIRSWDDLRNRLDSDRRCFALFHPRMPEEPLTFIEVALVKGIARNVQTLLDESAPQADPGAADTAIFYSISNTQRGLRGVTFGDHLIKQAVQSLAHDLPGLKVFSTLSPVPGFRKWLRDGDPEKIDVFLQDNERDGIRALGENEKTLDALDTILAVENWFQDKVTEETLRGPLMRLCTAYFHARQAKGLPVDPVARFHLKNGARLEHMNWLGDTSQNGIKQSAGIMVNYRYMLEDIEKNHEAYMKDHRIAIGSEVKALARSFKDVGAEAMKRLNIVRK